MSCGATFCKLLSLIAVTVLGARHHKKDTTSGQVVGHDFMAGDASQDGSHAQVEGAFEYGLQRADARKIPETGAGGDVRLSFPRPQPSNPQPPVPMIAPPHRPRPKPIANTPSHSPNMPPNSGHNPEWNWFPTVPKLRVPGGLPWPKDWNGPAHGFQPDLNNPLDQEPEWHPDLMGSVPVPEWQPEYLRDQVVLLNIQLWQTLFAGESKASLRFQQRILDAGPLFAQKFLAEATVTQDRVKPQLNWSFWDHMTVLVGEPEPSRLFWQDLRLGVSAGEGGDKYMKSLAGGKAGEHDTIGKSQTLDAARKAVNRIQVVTAALKRAKLKHQAQKEYVMKSQRRMDLKLNPKFPADQGGSESPEARKQQLDAAREKIGKLEEVVARSSDYAESMEKKVQEAVEEAVVLLQRAYVAVLGAKGA